MTDVSQAVRDDAELPPGDDADRAGGNGSASGEPTGGGPAGGSSARGGGPRRRGVALLAGLAALVAVVCAGLLPFAPVSVNEPTVSWPRDPARPESTLLNLTAYRPLAIDVRFTCDAARLAEPAGGVVVSTTLPESPLPLGLRATVAGGVLEIRAQGEVLLTEPLGPGPCEYRISGESRGLPTLLAKPTDPNDPAQPDPADFAAPDNAELVVTRDGAELLRAPLQQLPDVDVLATSLTTLPTPGGLAVSLRVDDEFTSSPTPLKALLIGMVLAGLVATAVLLGLLDRGVASAARRLRPGLPRVVDVVIPAAVVFWMFVAPATDDDGYYAAMARNSALSGEVGNYYQLYDQNFTPFTWFYQALGWWQQLAGDAPVMQRIPAAVFGVLTWLVLRRFAAVAVAEWTRVEPEQAGWAQRNPRTVAAVTHAVLAVVFLSWWIPQDMGVRPETVVALCGAAAMLAVLTAARSRRLVLAWLAFALAGIGFAAHPTGFTLFAPLLAGLPLLVPLVRVPGDVTATAVRTVAVLSGGMVAPLVAFADGALRDFVRGQTLFLAIQAQESWTSEFQRWAWLLSQIPMGNFAKRAAVLLCVASLVWFAVLAVAARMRTVPLPTPLWLAGSTTALAVASLWITPSKWTHHFGAVAGVGSAFLALFLVTAVPLTRRVLRGSPLPVGVLAAAAVSAVVLISLAWHGPNQWPYAWFGGTRRPNLPPAVKGVDLNSLPLWVLLLAVTAAALVLLARRRGGGRGPDLRLQLLRAVPVVMVLSLAATTTYVVGTFGAAAVQGVPREAVWGTALADPTAQECAAAGVVQVLDPGTAQPLPVAAGLPAPPPATGFVPDGYAVGQQPQGNATDRAWGSLVAFDGNSAERSTGEMTTQWFALPPALPDGAAVTVLAAGTLGDGNSLSAVYGSRTGSGVTPLAAPEPLTDSARSAAWRTFRLDPPPGADVVRLEAVDVTGAIHGWLGFTAPAVQRPVTLEQLIPDAAPVALAWPLAFAYPCQRQPRIVDGITEPPAYAVLWGDRALSGLNDGAWQPFRGGAFGQVPRSQSVQQLAVVPGVDPYIEVYVLGTDLARAAYTVTETRRTVGGASTATDTGPGTGEE
ncbi:arabinosyltransferase domain-containing protein [Pseudonocardia nigra]|uniref:arabinosyltransferase domain-containing protein n=1 Tax=Pseudonocardia nigra TaxID=1921578 RepID=UPI001C5EE710|nr:arabinosyltransferase domain-containing protein [Pseudonocardia nigra]